MQQNCCVVLLPCNSPQFDAGMCPEDDRMIVVRWQQDKNGKDAWDDIEGKSGRDEVKDEK